MSDETHHIGCIDGSTISATRSPGGWMLQFGTLEARLSSGGAEKLAALLTAGSTDATPTAHDPHDYSDEIGEADGDPRHPIFEMHRDQPSRARRETINDLIEAGLLSPGTILEATYKGKQHLAEITDGGEFDIDGQLFDTPSAAAESIMSGKRNGWREWRVMDGSGLIELRWRYRACAFPENSDSLSETTVRQKRSTIERWLEFAVKQNLNPGERDDSAIEAFLSDRARSAKTLGNYLTNLDQWFRQCDKFNW